LDYSRKLMRSLWENLDIYDKNFVSATQPVKNFFTLIKKEQKEILNNAKIKR